MLSIPEDQLRTLRIALEDEVRHIEFEIDNLRSKLQQKREQIKAVDTLVKPPDNGNGASLPRSLPKVPNRPSNLSSEITPTDAYWMPILEALEGRGDREHCDIVLDLVEKKMSSILKPEDYELLPSGISVRWRNRAQWQRQNMVQQGLLSKTSPRGVWEITGAGRAWLQEKKKMAS